MSGNGEETSVNNGKAKNSIGGDPESVVQRLFNESLQGGDQAARAQKEAEKLLHSDKSSLAYLNLARCKLQAIETLLSNSSIQEGAQRAHTVDRFVANALAAINSALQASRLCPECGIFALQLAWAMDLERNRELEQIPNYAVLYWGQSIDAEVFSEFHEGFDEQFNSRSPAEAFDWAVNEAQRLLGNLREELEEDFGDRLVAVARNLKYREQFVLRAKQTPLLTNALRAKWALREESTFFVQLNTVGPAILRCLEASVRISCPVLPSPC